MAGLALTALPAQTAHAASTLTNGGFETDAGGAATPAGWSEYGSTGAPYTEAGGHGGGNRLSHWSSSAYKVETCQYLSGLADGSLPADRLGPLGRRPERRLDSPEELRRCRAAHRPSGIHRWVDPDRRAGQCDCQPVHHQHQQ